MLLCQPDNVFTDIRSLQINSDQHVVVLVLRDQFENFVNCRNFLTGKVRIKPTACIEFFNLGKCQIGQLAAAVGGSIHCSVVNADEMTVFRSFNIEFKPEPQFEAGSKVGHRVFRCVTKQATMSDDQRARWFVCKDFRSDHKKAKWY